MLKNIKLSNENVRLQLGAPEIWWAKNVWYVVTLVYRLKNYKNLADKFNLKMSIISSAIFV